MLGGGDQHALFLQAGGVAHLGYIASYGLDFIAIQIDATEDDAGSGRRRQDSQSHRRAAVQTHTLALYRGANCLLE